MRNASWTSNRRPPWACLAVVAGFLLGCGAGPQTTSKRLIVLGVDGMDPKFLERHWADLPNLDRLRQQGEFKPLATSNPPQSPVAWSSVTTGLDPGGHGIFDFVHRDPLTRMPFSSMAETAEPERTLEIGDYVIPLSAGEVIVRRQGEVFWKLLADRGIPATVVRMPANYPPVECEARTLSGMGTPDLQGTYGTFTFFTDDPNEKTRTVAGGAIVRLSAPGDTVELDVPGPLNTLHKERPQSSARLTVHRDPSEPVARFEVAGESVVLRQGDWSGWLPADFDLIDGVVGAHGMFRIYAKHLRPRFEVYVSPVNIDPMSPDAAITTPTELSATFAKQIGRYYTQGMAEDTAALRAGVLNVEEFMAQTQTVLDESRALFREELARFESGLLFFYFSSVDQNAHMLWEDYEPELLKVYQQVDEAIGEAMAVSGESTTLIVMSDHGFMRYKRSVHLNTILMNEGFLALDDPANAGDAELFAHVDWSRTQAYSLGLNAIYLNRYGRERGGIVAEGEEQQAIRDKIRAALVAFRDPETGEQAIDEVYQPAQVFQGKNLEFAPDLLVGYRPPYRASWETTLGGVPGATVGDNTEAWIGDHCVAPRFVPGVWLSNRVSPVSDPRLVDLPVTILAEFGLPAGQGMLGRRLFGN